MKSRSLVVISAGVRQPSSTRLLADQIAAAVGAKAAEADIALAVQIIDLREFAHDVVNATLTGFPSPNLAPVLDAVARADALIAATPIFAASYSGLFKAFFDILEPRVLADKPVLIAATGGTARHSLALDHAMRPLFSYLSAVVMPTAVFAAPEDWGGASATGTLASRIERAAAELIREIDQREPTIPLDPFEQPIPFDQLLNGFAPER